MQNERKVLISALLKSEKNGYSNLILDHLLNETDLNDAGRAFVTSAFYGVLERKKTVDHVLNQFLKRPIQKAPPYTAAVLRSGAYQILFMDKIPASAAVNESVKLIKKSKENGNAGLVNAVLRNLAGQTPEALLRDITEPSICYSVEPWILKELTDRFGAEKASAFLEDSLHSPPVFIRINHLMAGAFSFVSDEIQKNGGSLLATDLAHCYRVEGLHAMERMESYHRGLFFVQDYSSQRCAVALGAKPKERILDCCAAPGGKSFSIALHMENSGEVISCDLYEQRVGLIAKGAERLGLSSIRPTVSDATKFDATFGLFDRVICDAPCSGIGVIRRKPEIKYKSQQESVDLQKIQRDILVTASRYVRPGGRLVYSTCTVLWRENEAVVTEFLKENPAFSLIADQGKAGMQTFLPPDDLGDGFFVAVMERKC